MLDLLGSEATFERLAAGNPVHFALDACLIVRRPASECGICRDVCPVGVLSGGQWSIALSPDGCLGCGQCAAACPTGALMVETSTPCAPPVTYGSIVIECRRVADVDRDPHAVVVSCLGGLTTPDLLDLVAERDASVVLADRGWCATCPVGGVAAPWQAVLDETRWVLAAVDPSLADSVAVERHELPIERARPVTSALRPDKLVARRDLLRRLVDPVRSSDLLTESRRAVSGRGLVSPHKRQRILQRISALAENRDRPMPTALTPAIRVADGCELSGVCAAICPTGALRLDQDDDSVSLQFDAAACIACGECQQACPSKALSLWPQGHDMAHLGTTTLIRRQSCACASCGTSFVPTGGEQTCPFCSKAENLMRDLARLSRGAAAVDVNQSNARLHSPRGA